MVSDAVQKLIQRLPARLDEVVVEPLHHPLHYKLLRQRLREKNTQKPKMFRGCLSVRWWEDRRDSTRFRFRGYLNMRSFLVILKIHIKTKHDKILTLQ